MSEETLREALERLAKLTPGSANAHTAQDLCLTVRAIAESALTTPPTPDRIGKDAVREARGHVVTAIAFLNRDQHSDRINETVGHVVGVLAEADEVLRATTAQEGEGDD